MQIVWTGPAIGDLGKARRYIALDNPSAATKQAQFFLAAVNGLLRHPEMGRIGRRSGTRELVIPNTPFIVAYRQRGETIEVLRVLHGRQRWPDNF